MPDTSRIAIVTGGSRGLGRNTVVALARTGVDSIVTYHSNRDEAVTVLRPRPRLPPVTIAIREVSGMIFSVAVRLDHYAYPAQIGCRSLRESCPFLHLPLSAIREL